MRAFYVGLMPWLAFIVADRSAGLGPSRAAIVGLVVAIGIAALEARSRRLRPLTFLAAAELSVLGVISAHGTSTAGVWRYDRALAIGMLAIVFAVSSFIAPLTAPYARDVVTPRQWTDRRFLRANAALTREWALSLSLVATSFAFGATFESPLATTIFNWLIPILMVAVAASRLTQSSENDRGPTALSALDCLMSESRDDGAKRGPRRLTW